MRGRTAGLVLVVTAVLAAAGCADGAADPAPGVPVATGAPTGGASSAAPPAAATSPAGAAAVAATLRFSGRTLDGKTFDGASLAGRPAVLWFWAPWCPTCRGQAPGVAATAAQFAGRAAVVGVAGLDGEAAMKRFVSDRGLQSVPHLSDEAGEVWRRFGVTQQSTFVLLDSAGTVTFKGYLDGAELAERVGRLS